VSEVQAPPRARLRAAGFVAVLAGAVLCFFLLRYAGAPKGEPVLPPPPSGIPQRVASLNLAADEVLAEILPFERLVGVTRFVDEPGTSNIIGRVPPQVFRFPKADMEALIARQADLVVISEYTDADFRALLLRSGMQVHAMRGLDTFDGVRRAILDLGSVVGEAGSAARVVQEFDASRAALRAQLAGVPRPRVLYWSGGMTAGANTAIGSLIEEAGGSNVGAQLKVKGILPIGGERAYAADPDMILAGDFGQGGDELRQHPLLRNARAVREGHIVQLPNQLLVTLSQHLAESAWQLAALLHPGLVLMPVSSPGPSPNAGHGPNAVPPAARP
jgi:ABC-type Fe3+-hydroxamate transport system substrate-binding protein